MTRPAQAPNRSDEQGDGGFWWWPVPIGAAVFAAGASAYSGSGDAGIDSYVPVSFQGRLMTLAVLGVAAGLCGTLIPDQDKLAAKRAGASDGDGEPSEEEVCQLFAGCVVGPVLGLLITFASHVLWFGFAGWTWRFLLLAILVGAGAGWLGSRHACASLDWSRKVQRGSLGLKRMGHRKTLYGISALWWVSRFFSNAIAGAQAGNAAFRERVDAYEPGWFTGGLVADVQGAARSATEAADVTLRLIGVWNTIFDMLALAGIGWSLYWLRHDAAVREAETGETGLFSNEVWILVGVNVAVWFALRALWPG